MMDRKVIFPQHYEVILTLHPKHQQPDGIWFVSMPDGGIRFCKHQKISLCFYKYSEAFSFVRDNTFINATINHPTSKIFKL